MERSNIVGRVHHVHSRFFNRNRFSFLEFSSVLKNKKKDEGMMKQVEKEMNLLEPNSLSCSNR
jgi:hypothetical protein